VQNSLPTAVVDVKDTSGAHVPGAKLYVDGSKEEAALGHALTLNPGLHELRLEAPGFKTRSQSVLVVEGERRRRVVFRMTRDDESDSSGAGDAALNEQSTAAPWTEVPVLTAFAVGVVGLGAFAYFGLDSRKKDEALDDCWDACSPGRIDRVERGYLFANVSLGVGLAGLASGVLLATVFGADEASGTSVQASANGVTVSTRGRF
jgi:hypothetical protein